MSHQLFFRPAVSIGRLSLWVSAIVSLGVLPAAAELPPRAEILHASAHGVSVSLRSAAAEHAKPALPVIPLLKPNKPGRGGGGGGGSSWSDADRQTSFSATGLGSVGTLGPGGNGFAGVSANGSVPPDTNLAVGNGQVVQITNTEYQVFDTSGNPLLANGPLAIHAIFANLGGSCASSDGGDPVVLYDRIANRWVVSQLEYTQNMRSNQLCVAVSTTSDATGSYNLYSYDFGSNLPDYPKLGVWKDAYYLTANIFARGTTFTGAEACALPSAVLQSGGSAAQATAVCFSGSNLVSLLPATVDGATLPASGEAEYLLQMAASGGVGSGLQLYRFHVDFATPANSTFTLMSNLAVNTFHEACGGGACIPQASTSQQLDSLGDRLMYALHYRNFGSYESLVVNHSVQASSSSNQTGVRWYELRVAGGSASVAQQSTFAPNDGQYRWMGSIAQDKAGNMAMGYSESSSTQDPSIYLAGRQSSTAANQMLPEKLVLAGLGAQNLYTRWGDYSAMAIDPADDCTFWYTTEYEPAGVGAFNWETWIASFKFNGCN